MRRVNLDVPTAKLELEGGDWVEYKTRLTVRDREHINNAVVGNMSATDDGIPMRFGAATTATLERAIVRWGGPGFCQEDHDAPLPEDHRCESVPIDAESIGALDDETGTLILNEINKRNPQPTSPKGLSGRS